MAFNLPASNIRWNEKTHIQEETTDKKK